MIKAKLNDCTRERRLRLRASGLAQSGRPGLAVSRLSAFGLESAKVDVTRIRFGSR